MTKSDPKTDPQKNGQDLPYDPDTPVSERQGVTAAMLKDDISSGRTGDKTGFPDPGAAPLGTCEEAAGQPSTREQLAIARRQEASRPSERSANVDRRPAAPKGPGGKKD